MMEASVLKQLQVDQPAALDRLRDVLAEDRLTKALMTNAQSLGVDTAAFEGAHVSRVHPRNDGGFVLDVETPGTASDTGFFVEVVAGDAAEHAERLMRRRSKQGNRLGETVPMRIHVNADAGLVMRRKGEDELLDGLIALHRPETFDAGMSGSAVATRLLAHRLNRRAVFEAETATGEKQIVKLYKKGSGKAQSAIETSSLLERTAFGAASPVRVPKILGSCPRWPGYVMACADGVPISQLQSHLRHVGFSLAGAALGRLHRLPLRLQENHTTAQEQDLLRNWVHLTCAVLPEQARLLTKAQAHVDRLLADSAPQTFTMVHRDFHEGQVLVSNGSATLIDFDTVCNGEPSQDIGNFLAHLDYSGLVSGTATQDDETAFITAYELTHADIHHARVAAHRAATLLRLSCIHAHKRNGRAVCAALAETSLAS